MEYICVLYEESYIWFRICNSYLGTWTLRVGVLGSRVGGSTFWILPGHWILAVSYHPSPCRILLDTQNTLQEAFRRCFEALGLGFLRRACGMCARATRELERCQAPARNLNTKMRPRRRPSNTRRPAQLQTHLEINLTCKPCAAPSFRVHAPRGDKYFEP